MSRIGFLILTATISAGLATISVHYLEEALLPVVEAARLALYGEQSYSSALSGCEALDGKDVWVHPTALALTVYGDTQAVLVQAFGRHGTEVLPDYAEERRGKGELFCVANYLLIVGKRRVLDGLEVRVFPFETPHAVYGLESGWVSGLTQGMVGQVFLAAYLVSGADRYLNAAREAGRVLAVPVEQGGVQVRMRDDAVWYEEYAQVDVSPPLVLNGHLLALDFLYWMKQQDEEAMWTPLFDAGLLAVVNQIDEYRSFAWSYYDQQANLATRKYQAFHVRQLARYSTHDDTGALADARDTMQWQLLLPVGIFQRLLTQPSRLLLFLIGLCSLVYFAAVWPCARVLVRNR